MVGLTTVVQFGGAAQRIHGGSALAATVGPNEYGIFASQGDTAQRAFGRIVIDFGNAVIALQQQCRPLVERVLMVLVVSDLADSGDIGTAPVIRSVAVGWYTWASQCGLVVSFAHDGGR